MSTSQIPEILKTRIRNQTKNRCGYCLSWQKYVLGILEIDHIIPKDKGGTDDESNLWLACRLCNNYKGTQPEAKDSQTNEIINLFNLQLNNLIAVTVRRQWVSAGWHPPESSF